MSNISPAETPYDDFQIARAIAQGHLRVAGQLHLSYANDPLVYEATLGDSGSEQYRIVEHQVDDRITTTTRSLPNTDNAEGPDFLDVDSDSDGVPDYLDPGEQVTETIGSYSGGAGCGVASNGSSNATWLVLLMIGAFVRRRCQA